jgi:hypothetical protein
VVQPAWHRSLHQQLPSSRRPRVSDLKLTGVQLRASLALACREGWGGVEWGHDGWIYSLGALMAYACIANKSVHVHMLTHVCLAGTWILPG